MVIRTRYWKNIKLIVFILILTASVCIFTGCGGESPAEKKAVLDESVPVAEGEKLILDCVGRTVAIPESPQKVAALDSFAGEALVMCGAGSKMIAAPNGVKMDELLCNVYPGLADVSVPMSGGTINAETLLALKPDLVLLKDTMYQTTEEVEKLDKLGIKYLVVKYENMAEQQQALQMIGDALGGEYMQKAADINAYYKSVVEKAQSIAAKIPKNEKVRVYHSINELVRTDGTDTLGYDWVTCVGAENVSASEELQSEGGDYYSSPEQIFVWNPDVIICNEADTVDYLCSDDKWQGLQAVQEGKVYNIPVGATRWGQRGSLETFFAILWLGTTIYPEYYADVDLKKEVFDFYKNYLNVTLDDDTYEKILSGRGIRTSSAAAGQ
ncbi:MAG: ABC transporter substrate-binding protein [Bacillota bacterium]